MNTAKLLVLAAATTFLANVSIAGDSLKAKKPAGVISIKTGENRVSIFEVPQEHKAILVQMKEVAAQVAEGKMEEDADEAKALEATVLKLKKDGKIKFIASSTLPSEELTQSSDESKKACFGWGGGWGGCGGCFHYGWVQPVVVVQPIWFVQTQFHWVGGWGRVGCWF